MDQQKNSRQQCPCSKQKSENLPKEPGPLQGQFTVGLKTVDKFLLFFRHGKDSLRRLRQDFFVLGQGGGIRERPGTGD